MTGLIPQDFIDDLVQRVPIADVVGTRITLKKSGGTLKACCPFHQEKTPSFHVNSQKNFYHCFGCGANGNGINFLRDYENLSFNDAVEELAKIAGIAVPKDEKVQQAYSLQNKLNEALEYASLRYRDALKSHKNQAIASNYIKKRDLSPEILERFAIGFAPAERDFLSSKASPEILKSLIQTKTISNKYERVFDLFQNRLMFPIRNARGKTIAFGGRTLGDDKAKYINSPESEIFHKSHELYGIYEANKTNRQLTRLLVVEGYMDVVSLAQYGINYAVATLGTATNAENLSQLLNRCKNLVFCFDGDNAGIQAARKAMENALPLYQDGMQLSFLILPKGEDPDTLVRDEGKEAFEHRISNAKPLSEFLFQIYSEGLDLNIAEHKGILKQRAEAQINQLNSAVLKSALRQKLNTITFNRNTKFNKQTQEQARDLTGNKVIPDPETALCLALYYQPQRSTEIISVLTGLDDYQSVCAFAEVLQTHQIKDTESLLYFLASDDSGTRQHFSNLFDRIEWLPNAEQIDLVVQDLIPHITHHKKRSNALKATKFNKLPSQMTDEEKSALRAISVTKS